MSESVSEKVTPREAIASKKKSNNESGHSVYLTTEVKISI